MNAYTKYWDDIRFYWGRKDKGNWYPKFPSFPSKRNATPQRNSIKLPMIYISKSIRFLLSSNGCNPGLSSHTNYIHSFNSSTFRIRNHMKSLKSWRQRNGSNQCIFLIMNSTSPAHHVLLYIKSKHVSNFDQFASILVLNNPLGKKKKKKEFRLNSINQKMDE